MKTTLSEPEKKAGPAPNSRNKLIYLVKIAVLSAISIIVMLFSFPLPFAPPFYKLDFSETIVLIGGFALGPMAGVMIEMVKIALNLLINGTVTLGIGELSNFVMGCALVVPAALIYRRKKDLRHAVAGMAVGTVVLAVAGSLINLFVMLPVYAWAYGMPLDALVEMGSKINGMITGLGSFVLLAVVPFNLLKGVASSLLAGLLYKRVSPLLHRH